MASEWSEMRLGEVARLQKGVSYQGRFLDRGETRLLGLGTVVPGGGVKVDGARTYAGPIKDAQRIRPGELFIALTDLTQDGRILGSPAIVPDAEGGSFAITHHVARVEVLDPSRIDTRYLYYFLMAPQVRDHFRSMATGTTVRAVSPTDALRVVARVPDLREQRAIADLLGSLDDKIELNRRMGETLKALASAMYHGWFIDKVGLPEWAAPESWPEVPLGDLVIEHKRKVDPLSVPDTVFEHYSLPSFDAGDGPALDVGRSIRSAKTRVPVGSILVSRLNPRIPRVWLTDVGAPDRAIASTEFLVLTPRPSVGRAFTYLTVASPALQQKLIGMATGTSGSHQRVRPGAVLGVPIVHPEAAVLEAFGTAVEPLLDRRLNAARQNRVLTQLRDTLLPKLISGELRIPDAERLVSEVT